MTAPTYVRTVGKNSRSRRAAKRRKRAARNNGRHAYDDRKCHDRVRTGTPGGFDASIDPDRLIAELIDLAPMHLQLGDHRFVDAAIDRLCACPPHRVQRAVAAELRRAIPELWVRGWQPIELIRQARRTSALNASLARAAVSADHAGRRSSTVDQRWAQQLATLDLPTVTDPDGGTWVDTWARSASVEREHALKVVFDLLLTLRSLPRLETLIPPPDTDPALSTARSSAPDRGAIDQATLQRVRALLVKAESTTFQAEADAFTAKAHELMTRHAIDAAVVEADESDGSDAPATARIAIDDPYVDAKSLLLQVVAHASRCRTVFHTGLAMSSIVGFPADIAATEMLYTSLLVQAQTALAAEAKRTAAGGRSRSRSYRAAFLMAFAIRIGQRLDEVNASLVAEAEATTGRSVLPALRRRQSALDDTLAERFGAVRSQALRGGNDPIGWVDGRLAADRARLPVRRHRAPRRTVGVGMDHG